MDKKRKYVKLRCLEFSFPRTFGNIRRNEEKFIEIMKEIKKAKSIHDIDLKALDDLTVKPENVEKLYNNLRYPPYIIDLEELRNLVGLMDIGITFERPEKPEEREEITRLQEEKIKRMEEKIGRLEEKFADEFSNLTELIKRLHLEERVKIFPQKARELLTKKDKLQLEKIRDDLDRLIKEGAKANKENYLRLGLAAQNEENLEKAIDYYNKAIEIDSKYAKAWTNRGLALSDLAKYEEALRSYDKAIEIDPKYARAWSNRGLALSDLAKYEEALRSHDKAIEIDPKNAFAWNNRAMLLQRMNKFEKALENVNKSIELNDKNPYAWSTKGYILGKMGKYKEGIECSDKAKSVLDEPDAWYERAVIQLWNGRSEDARKSLERGLDLDPKRLLFDHYKDDFKSLSGREWFKRLTRKE